MDEWGKSESVMFFFSLLCYVCKTKRYINGMIICIQWWLKSIKLSIVFGYYLLISYNDLNINRWFICVYAKYDYMGFEQSPKTCNSLIQKFNGIILNLRAIMTQLFPL